MILNEKQAPDSVISYHPYLSDEVIHHRIMSAMNPSTLLLLRLIKRNVNPSNFEDMLDELLPKIYCDTD